MASPEQNALLEILQHIGIYLGTTVLLVPIAKRIGLGSVLGYLSAGILIGPWGLQLITNAEEILHFSEFGVVLLLFLIGLELSPATLWSLRKPIFGLGGLQLLSTSLLLWGALLLFNFNMITSFVAALGLALSSTAIGLQLLHEKNIFATKAGKTSFSILLFQDLAVIPMLALLPLLALPDAPADGSSVNAWLAGAKALGVVVGLVLVGHFALRPTMRLLAKTGLSEIFTAFALFLVIGIALLMHWVNLSMALGTFIAGLLLADSEYRHALETVIEPLKGLLMGLFFVAVGMSIDFGLLKQESSLIFALVLTLVGIKALVLFIIGRLAHLPRCQTALFAVLLSQGGEFAFVIFSLARSKGILLADTIDLLVLVVALSMMTTPLLMFILDKRAAARLKLKQHAKQTHTPENQQFDEETPPVIIAGFGRFGQIIGRLLHANQIPVTLLDHDPDHIERTRKYGFKVFYGDATTLSLLRAAGADKAQILFVAIDDREQSLALVRRCQRHFPHLKLIVRAWDAEHYFAYQNLGVEHIYRETFHTALRSGGEVLSHLGFSDSQVEQASLRFYQHDLHLLEQMYQVRDQGLDALADTSKRLRDHFNQTLEEDEQALKAYCRQQNNQKKGE